jgi:hypothetical protein
MKRIKVLVMLGLLLAMVLTLVVPAPATAATVTKFRFQGDSAVASFSSVDPVDPCIQTSAFVSATEGRLKEGGGRPTLVSEVFVNIFRYNGCTGEVYLDAFGVAELSPDAFVVQNQLAGAILTATVDVCDFVTGNCFAVDLDLTWSGTSAIIRDKSTFKSNSPGCKVRFSFQGSFRDGVATGTIDSPEFTFAGSSDFAQVASVKQGDIVIGCV